MNHNEVTEFKPLPGKEEKEYGSFRVKLLNVQTAVDGVRRCVTMNFVNVATGTPYVRGYHTTDKVGKFGWFGNEMAGITSGNSVSSGLDLLTENLGPEAVKKLKEFFDLLTDTREELEHTLHRG